MVVLRLMLLAVTVATAASSSLPGAVPRPAETGRAAPAPAPGVTPPAWVIADDAPLLTAAGRDVGRVPPHLSAGIATDRGVTAVGLARLPDGAFLIDELEKGWLRVDRHGRMQRLAGPAGLPSGHVGGLATTADGTVLVAEGGVVWLLRPGQALSRLAGTGGEGAISTEDGPALAATIGPPG